ncbi:MAG TPA: hypothetical protein VFB01_18720 [Burkholderiales bacterium]|nr:hypothetical protein [Burkholderiales bacterium]
MSAAPPTSGAVVAVARVAFVLSALATGIAALAFVVATGGCSAIVPATAGLENCLYVCNRNRACQDECRRAAGVDDDEPDAGAAGASQGEVLSR